MQMRVVMATYSFLKEANLYLVKESIKYKIDISSISFSQTFTEESYAVRNLHTADIFEGSVINKANPANFEIKIPALLEGHHSILFDCILDYSSFDLYISTAQDTFKLETSVITNGSFAVEKLKPLSLSISGESSKLLHLGNASYAIPGTESTREGRTYLRASDNSIVLDGTDMSEDTLSLSIELQNEIKWLPYNTLQKAVAGSTMYPTEYVLDERILAGSFQRYVLPDTDENLQSYNTDVSLRIKIGQEIGGTFYGFDFNMGSCSYTNRLNTGSVFTQNYDWRMTDNSTLSNILSYITQ